MTQRERFIKTLKREVVPGRVPTFELVFYLTMEVLGKVHPEHRRYHQWDQMTARERELQLQDMASCYIDIAEKYGHSAIFIHPNPYRFDEIVRLLEIIRERTDDQYFTMMHGDPTFGIPNGDGMVEFSIAMYEEPERLLEESRRRTDEALEFAARLRAHAGLLDGFALCSDYCFNTNPFMSPELFAQFIAPDLKRAIAGYREMGYYSIKHTDGNIMPILDQLVDCAPDALHSLDPQAGVDLKEVKRLYGDRIALCGNVNCGLLQTGTAEECIADARRSLREGMEGGAGYVFCTSNCAYTGLELERYEMIHRVWLEEGVYPQARG